MPPRSKRTSARLRSIPGIAPCAKNTQRVRSPGDAPPSCAVRPSCLPFEGIAPFTGGSRQDICAPHAFSLRTLRPLRVEGAPAYTPGRMRCRPPAHRSLLTSSLRTSDRCHWCGNPFSFAALHLGTAAGGAHCHIRLRCKFALTKSMICMLTSVCAEGELRKKEYGLPRQCAHWLAMTGILCSVPCPAPVCTTACDHSP